MTPAERAALRALCEGATPGPWNGEALNWTLRYERKCGTIPWEYCEDQNDVIPTDNEHDARFIAAARTALPQLLNEVERLETATEYLAECADEARARAKTAEARIAELEAENARLRSREAYAELVEENAILRDGLGKVRAGHWPAYLVAEDTFAALSAAKEPKP